MSKHKFGAAHARRECLEIHQCWAARIRAAEREADYAIECTDHENTAADAGEWGQCAVGEALFGAAGSWGTGIDDHAIGQAVEKHAPYAHTAAFDFSHAVRYADWKGARKALAGIKAELTPAKRAKITKAILPAYLPA